MPIIRSVAQLIGMMVTCFPGVEYGPLFHRQIDRNKTAVLKANLGDFDEKMTLFLTAFDDIKRWIDNGYVHLKNTWIMGKSIMFYLQMLQTKAGVQTCPIQSQWVNSLR